MSNPFDEPSWKDVSDAGPPKYSRPLLGSELVHDVAHMLNDGLGECCMGVTFKTILSYEELVSRTRESVARLRFVAPIIACTIVSDLKDPLKRSWVYSSPTGQTSLSSWIDNSLTVFREEFNTDEFILSMNKRRVPYTHADGHEQHMHVYLLVAPDGACAVFMHGPHTIMDARPTLRGLNLIVGWIANPPPDSVEKLAWGTEWEHLPAGPVKATGGPREDWGTRGIELMQETGRILMDPKLAHTLHPKRDSVKVVGNMLRQHATIDKENSARLVDATKAHGFSLSHLADAAMTLAILAMNPVEPNQQGDAFLLLDPTVISPDRFYVPPYDGPSQFVAGLATVPVRIQYKDIPVDVSPKERLLAVMAIIKAQYDKYIQNPNLPHLLTAQLAHFKPREPLTFRNAHSSIMTNLGKVESFINVEPGENVPAETVFMGPVVEIQDMAFGHRLGWERLMNHVWSMGSIIHLQVQASDIWDNAFLQDYLAVIKEQILTIL